MEANDRHLLLLLQLERRLQYETPNVNIRYQAPTYHNRPRCYSLLLSRVLMEKLTMLLFRLRDVCCKEAKISNLVPGKHKEMKWQYNSFNCWPLSCDVKVKWGRQTHSVYACILCFIMFPANILFYCNSNTASCIPSNRNFILLSLKTSLFEKSRGKLCENPRENGTK